MSLNIKNPEVERLLDDIVGMTGESKTEAIRKALDERRRRLQLQSVAPRSEARLHAFLENEIWPQVPPELLGKPITKEEEEAILGYGELGV
ncbi:MAG TPA: type II toxin-antitoxin system VapB family antitoxin [Promineifilum sp.]|nr:type II toxin-antitoxin system VapB family antitoxin [Promineifilum sp.]HRO89929.1 type II toxin-antitoxin system VapB family antitoxin [Promineifilum sp.]HRQ13890.1 type II toxin-antitoxin system VapB family antitoxin [Promineifilum sp.]